MMVPEERDPFIAEASDTFGIDAVVMLTWSDWQKEPRSNRYHYATRLAKQVPVLFCQVLGQAGDGIVVGPSGHGDIDIVNFSRPVSATDAREFRRLLYARGIRNPLIWIYNILDFGDVVESLPNAPMVLHATEDYFTPTAGMAVDIDVMKAAFSALGQNLDLLVAVSSGVLESYRREAGYLGPAIVLENGCDADFFFEIADQLDPTPSKTEVARIAIFQGGINARLDYDLLDQVTDRLVDWTFQFCGSVAESEGWDRIVAKPNVTYLGVLDPSEIGRALCSATVGIIPYIADRWIRNSLPLKAYEYVACGLPVVTVPIDALDGQPDLFDVADGAEAFALAIERAAAVRHDRARLATRRKAAGANAYDRRFAVLTDKLAAELAKVRQTRRRLKVGILYDVESVRVGTVKEHLEAFERYSQNDITYIPATRAYWSTLTTDDLHFDFSILQVLIVHYSLRLSIEDHMPPVLAQAIEAFAGFKVLFIQDEYDHTETARRWMDRFAFDLVYTCVPDDQREIVYPSYRYPASEFLPTLTGYVPEREGLDCFAIPHEKRRILIGYRGRRLSYVYGDLGQEKHRIGIMVRERARKAGLAIDIEVDDDKRLYGDSWYAFLGSVRATLGTESGSNIFDFDGSIARQIEVLTASRPEAGYEEIRSAVLQQHEGAVRMNQVSPKIFEAILLRTALVLFEGDYSGVVEADRHYIALKKDGSNLDDVLQKLQDAEQVNAMTERAYQDVIESGRYTYQAFVQGVDGDIEKRILRMPRSKPYFIAALAPAADGRHRAAWPLIPSYVCGAGVRAIDLAATELRPKRFASHADLSMRAVLKTVFRRSLRWLHRLVTRALATSPLIHREVKRAWDSLPDRLTIKVMRILNS